MVWENSVFHFALHHACIDAIKDFCRVNGRKYESTSQTYFDFGRASYAVKFKAAISSIVDIVV